MGTFWADVSQYQVPVNDSYPHPVFAFRTNSGDTRDKNAAANLDWALRSSRAIIIAYYFFRPGQANCDLWREMVTRGGKIDPRIVCMVDVEGAGGTITGDHSGEINDEIQRVQGWLGGNRVIGYYNPKADPGLWKSRPNIPLVVPHYGVAPGKSYEYPNRFAHQYADNVPCAPFGPCDANYTDLNMEQLRTLFFGQQPATGGNNMAVTEDWLKGFIGPMISDNKDIREQLTGSRDLHYVKPGDPKSGVDFKKSFPGWSQLGGRTLVDALAAVLTGFGVEGCSDPLGKVQPGQFLKASPAAKAATK